eukprot:CAMPEP_0181467132 /NCGR_PEP_ID=MMETSP1110-20121109/36816_1 /TAXON_ID=174948 /ORGANISM="Symbiodinium sp., Strain CCMP421" /LENGTH=1281 /DNA_ID=CAMNT_0023591939 /DNA_START=145 /DNA_END=3989 /DNA_ORIENTATION=+
MWKALSFALPLAADAATLHVGSQAQQAASAGGGVKAYISSSGTSLLEQESDPGDLGFTLQAQEADGDDHRLLGSSFGELDMDVKVKRGSGDLAADSLLRIDAESPSDAEASLFWTYVNLGAEPGHSQEVMHQQAVELTTLGGGTSGLGAKRSYRTATSIVGSSAGKAAEWSNLALAGRSFIGLFRNASSEAPARWKIYAVQPTQVSITTMRSSEEKGQLLGREQIQTFASEDNDVVQLTSTGDVLVQSSEESFDFQQLAPVDEAVYGICHELCAVLSFDRKATTLIEECADGTTKTYDKTSMVEETYWSLSTAGKACRWYTPDGTKVAGTSQSDEVATRASFSLLPPAYFQESTPFAVALKSVKVIGTQATTCKVEGRVATLAGTGSVFSAELAEVPAKTVMTCDRPVMVLGFSEGIGDMVQLVTAASPHRAAYTKLGSGVCDSSDKFDKFTLEEEYPFLTEEKMLDWKLITTREKAGICNADSIEECFHVCSVVTASSLLHTSAVNCRACLLFKNCQNRESQSLVQDDLEGGGDSVTQVESDFHMYDIFQMEQGDVDVDAEKNLVKNPSFTEGKNGWADLCPPMMYNGKNLTFGCKNSGIWDAVPKDVGGDTNAYHVKENCFQGSRGGFYQDVKTEMGYTYELTFKLIDGYFSKKKAKEEKAWVEVSSPPGQPVMEEQVKTSASSAEPIEGQWQTQGPFRFVAASNSSRIYFYSGGTACTNIDDVVLKKTKASKKVVFNFATLVREGHFIVTKGSFVMNASDNSSKDGSSIRVVKDNIVVLKPSEAAGDADQQTQGENDMDIDTRDLTAGGCSRVSGFVRYVPKPLYSYAEDEESGNLVSAVSFELQEPIGHRVEDGLEVGVTGSIINAVLDPSPESIRLRVKKDMSGEFDDTGYMMEVQLNFFCSGGGDSRKHWKLNTYQYAGNEGLCMSLVARDSVGIGCHEVTCRMNAVSDASLQPCNEEDWAQNFYADGHLLRSASPADRCLAVDYSSSSSDCKPLSLKLCDESDAGQRWTIQGGQNAQDIAVLRMDDGLVVSVPKAGTELASFDMPVQACKEEDMARVKAFNQIASNMVANLVMVHELATNFTEKASGGSELILSNVWAEAICPWFFNPPIHTDSKLIKCYNRELCNPEEDGESCCNDKGGTFMCSMSAPYMCKSKTNGKNPGDYFCAESIEECETHGGRRICEGPPGKAGSSGEYGDDGEPGEDGPEGPEGSVVEALPVEAHSGKSGMAQPATLAELIGAVAVNLAMAVLVFVNLRGKIKNRFEGKSKSVAPNR